MSELLINQKTEELIQLYAKNPAHAVIIAGPAGSGTGYVAKRLIELAFPKAYVKSLEPVEGKSIGIEQVRGATGFLKIKSSSNDAVRVLLVNCAELLTEEAQNALLKTLEEPAANSAILLVTTSAQVLLPTIRSRAISIDVLPLSYEQVSERFSDILEPELKKHFILSEGNSELLTAMISDPEHPLKVQIDVAKKFLRQSTFERVKAIEDLKDSADTLVDSVAKIAKTALTTDNISNIERRRWIKIYEAATDSESYLQAYVSKKAVLLNLALSLN